MAELSLVEIGGAIIWAASVVAVTGYTVDAFKATYKTFPGPSGGASKPAPPAPQAGFQSPFNPARKFGPGVTASARIPGTNTPSPALTGKSAASVRQQLRTGKQGPTPVFKRSVAPPGNLASQLKTTTQQGNHLAALRVFYAIQDWGARNGVARIQIENWMAEQSYYPKLRNILPLNAW